MSYRKDYLEYGDFHDRPLAYLREHEPDYRDACFLSNRWPKTFELPRYFAHGDYVQGSSYGQSNYEVWKEQFAKTEGKTWWDLGSNGILVRLTVQPTEEKEALAALDDYPLMDDEHHNQLEMKLQDEAWNDWGRKDFKRELEHKAFEILDGDSDSVDAILAKVPDKLFDEATHRMYEENGHYPEGSDDISFPYGDFVTNYDGSLKELLEFLGLESTSVTLRLSDAAFTDWKEEKGQKVRRIRIKKEDLPPELSTSVKAALIRNSEAFVPIAEIGDHCESLYIECEYPWSLEHPDEPEEETP
jgi:hypothetical protein